LKDWVRGKYVSTPFWQIRQHYSNGLMVELSIRGFDTLDNWQQRAGVGDPGYIRMGYMLFVASNQIEALNRNIELGQSLGVDTRFVGPDEIQQIEPGITVNGLTDACYEPNGGYIDVTRMVLDRGPRVRCTVAGTTRRQGDHDRIR
jgi:glycine/D-amino acid oxidase-like deaminating enzyme